MNYEKEKNIEAKMLAQIANIDAANLSRIEQGRYSVGLDILSRITFALGAKIELVDLVAPKNLKIMVNVNHFEKECECIYKDECYSVRDNGTVLRYTLNGKRPRPTDNQWTFGKPNKNWLYGDCFGSYSQNSSDCISRRTTNEKNTLLTI